jgi:hypothetical protein
MVNQLLQLSVLQPPVVKNSAPALFSNIPYYIDEFLTTLHSSRLVRPEHGVPPSLEALVPISWRWFQVTIKPVS